MRKLKGVHQLRYQADWLASSLFAALITLSENIVNLSSFFGLTDWFMSDLVATPKTVFLAEVPISCSCMIVRLSLLRKTILIPEYLAFMCVCVFVDGCISQF